ncbi:hypothetical protein Leryth_019079 [Lithospermum erythrorhizon]|nr:hypothetical protein Leryth_019079 [Lithospermum erythrorhizon]
MGQGKLKKPKLICEEGRILGEDSTSSGITHSKEEHHRAEKQIILSKYQNEPQVLKSHEICSSDDANSDICSQSFQSCDEEIRKSVVIKSNASHVECREETPKYGSRLKKIHGKPINVPRYETECGKMVDLKLSTNAIIRLAGENFIQFLESSSKDLLMACHLFSKEFSSLNREDARDAELVFYLLASAEKVGQQQFDHARKLLKHCEELSSCVGDPVQRLVYYFFKALIEKIDRETLKTTASNLGMKQLLDVEENMMRVNSTYLALTKVNPTGLFIQVAGIQAIVEHVTKARKVHIIDLSIKGGQQHSMLIQALAVESGFHLEHLKITAIGTTSESKIEETVMVDDILDLEEGLLSVDSDETVVVYCAYFLRSMLGQPDLLESLMRVIKNTKPSLMIVAEIESNHNSPVFVNRFIEALFFFGAQFDALEDCMKNDESNRSIMESFFFSKGIHNIMATEGDQRAFREVKVEVWRSFLNRYGMLETPLSMSSLSQAKLMLKNYSCASSCTIDKDGECLTIGWKGTPLYSLSAWRAS